MNNSRHQGHDISADWTYLFRHHAEWNHDGSVLVDASMSKSLDDSDGPTEIWCHDCDTHVDDAKLEIHYT